MCPEGAPSVSTAQIKDSCAFQWRNIGALDTPFGYAHSGDVCDRTRQLAMALEEIVAVIDVVCHLGLAICEDLKVGKEGGWWG